MLAGSTANFHAWQYLRNLWSLLDDYWDGEVVGSRALASAMALAAKALTGQTPPAPHNIYRHILSKRRTPTV
jgi:hypothetical protein